MNDPKDHWIGMPEFTQEKLEPYSCINVRFECEADLMEFSELIGQKLTKKTKSLWIPKKEGNGAGMKRWV